MQNVSDYIKDRLEDWKEEMQSLYISEKDNDREVSTIKFEVMKAIPVGVATANIIIALAEIQRDMARLIIEGDS